MATTPPPDRPSIPSLEEERCALELRAEKINLVAMKRAERRGVSDRLEIGKEAASDTATGHEEVNVAGNYRLEGYNIDTRASIVKRTFRGRLNLRLYSDTLMLSGALSETLAGVVTVCAGMIGTDLLAGGLRVTTGVDIHVISGFVGLEEKFSSTNDKLLLEIAGASFQREYQVASYKAGFVSCSGEAIISMGVGATSMMEASLGFRSQIKGQAKIESSKTDMRSNPAAQTLTQSIFTQSLHTPNSTSRVLPSTSLSQSLPMSLLDKEIVPATKRAISKQAVNRSDILKKTNQPPPRIEVEDSPPTTALHPLDENASSSYLNRTSSSDEISDYARNTAANDSVDYRFESTHSFTNDIRQGA